MANPQGFRIPDPAAPGARWEAYEASGSYAPAVASSDGGFTAAAPFTFSRVGKRVTVSGALQCGVSIVVPTSFNITIDTPSLYAVGGGGDTFGLVMYGGTPLAGYDPTLPLPSNGLWLDNGGGILVVFLQGVMAAGDLYCVQVAYPEP